MINSKIFNDNEKNHVLTKLEVQLGGNNLNGTFFLPDSIYIPKFIQNNLSLDPETMFKDILNNAPWQDPNASHMKYRNKNLPRKKAFLVVSKEEPPSFLPKYGYPGFQWESILFYHSYIITPSIKHLIDKVNSDIKFISNGKLIPPEINSIIVTKYEDKDNIGFHNDKVKDIAPESFIMSFSFGASREMHFKETKTNKMAFSIKLESGDLFILGPQSNLRYQHSIVSPKKNILDNQDIDIRISMVGRKIKTIYSIENAWQEVEKSRKRKAIKAKKEAFISKN